MNDYFPEGAISLGREDGIQVVRTRPTMLLHRLARYVEASPAQRRRMVAHEKRPSVYQVCVEPANHLFADALRLGWRGERFYELAQEHWRQQEYDTDADLAHRELALQAASEFSVMIDALRRNLLRCGIRVSVTQRVFEPLKLSGVSVMDAPTVVLRQKRGQRTEIGLLSFHISKMNPHSFSSARTAAVLLHEFAVANERYFRGTLTRELCVVVDVFSSEISDARLGWKRRLGDVVRACDEIANSWPEA